MDRTRVGRSRADRARAQQPQLHLPGSLTPGGRASIAVTYRFEPAVESWAPASMEERYDYPARRDLDWVVGAATYSNYRRFTVGAKIVR